jgi:hypothetical protein
MVISNQLLYSDELGHRHLVDECRSVSHAGGVLWHGLAQAAPEPRVLAIFL